MVLADADVAAGMPLRAALADDDVAGKHGLVAELLDAEAAPGRVAAVAGRAACFLVGHDELRNLSLAGFARESIPKMRHSAAPSPPSLPWAGFALRGARGFFAAVAS